MLHRWLFVLPLVVIGTATTAVWGAVRPFNLTGEMTLTPATGYNNQINVYIKQSIASGNKSTGTSGSHLLQLCGNVDTVTNAVSLTGMGFVQRSGTGQISAQDFTVDLLFGAVRVAFTGLKADLGTPSRPIDVVGGSSYSTSGSGFVMNGGGYTISSGGGHSYASSPDSAPLLNYTGSLTVSSISRVGDDVHFLTTAIVPIHTDTTGSDGTQTKITGNLRSVGEFVVTVPEPGTIAMVLSLAASLAGYGWLRRRGEH